MLSQLCPVVLPGSLALHAHLAPALEPLVELVDAVLRLRGAGRVPPVERAERRGVKRVARRAAHRPVCRVRARAAASIHAARGLAALVNTHTYTTHTLHTQQRARERPITSAAVREGGTEEGGGGGEED